MKQAPKFQIHGTPHTHMHAVKCPLNDLQQKRIPHMRIPQTAFLPTHLLHLHNPLSLSIPSTRRCHPTLIDYQIITNPSESQSHFITTCIIITKINTIESLQLGNLCQIELATPIIISSRFSRSHFMSYSSKLQRSSDKTQASDEQAHFYTPERNCQVKNKTSIKIFVLKWITITGKKAAKLNKKHFYLKYIILFIALMMLATLIAFIRQSPTLSNPINNIPHQGESIKSLHTQTNQNKKKHQKQTDHSIAVKRFEQTLAQQIIQTYVQYRQQIKDNQQLLQEKNAQAINEAKIQEKQNSEEKKSEITRTYDKFDDKLQQVGRLRDCVMIDLLLFPFLQPWATTPKSTTITQKLTYHLFTKLFLSETYPWDDLYDMLKSGGYWQSSGNMLTVATYSNVVDDEYGSLQLFVPTIIKLEFPYDTPNNETVKFTGVRLRYDLHKRVETRWISQFLGQLRVDVTQQERRLQQPVQRTFYCEEQSCNFLYSMVQLETINRLRLHSFKINSVFSVGKTLPQQNA